MLSACLFPDFLGFTDGEVGITEARAVWGTRIVVRGVVVRAPLA